MPASPTLTFKKEERICSKLLIEKLFSGGKSQSLASFPLRVVFMEKNRTAREPQTQLLISVPKRCLKHAVDRNKVKRLVREAYRNNRQLLTDVLSGQPDTAIAIAFIWLDNHVADATLVETRVKNILQRIGEKFQKKIGTPI